MHTTILNNTQWLILIAGAAIGGGLIGFVAEGVGSDRPFTWGGVGFIVVFALGFLLLTGGSW